MGRPGWIRTASALWRSTHPEPTAGVTAVVGLLALTAGAGWRTVPLTAAVLTNQFSIGWDNDALDAARDSRNGRRDKPIAAGQLSAGTVRVAAVAAAGACALLSSRLGARAALANLSCVASGWAYNHLAKPTVFSVVPYLVGFAALPATVPFTVGAPVPRWLVSAGALLGAAAHFANVVPDIDADLADGIRGLPQRLGPGASRVSFAGLLVAASAVLAAAPAGSTPARSAPARSAPARNRLVPVAAVGLAVGLAGVGVVVGARRPESRVLFRTAIAVAGIDVALLLARGGGIR